MSSLPLFRHLALGVLLGNLLGCAGLPNTGGAASIPEDRALTLSGEFTTRSPINVNDGSRHESFALQLQADQVVEARVQSEFGGTLTLLDDQQRLINGPGTSVLSLAPTRDGRYQLALSGDSATRFGPFSVKLNRITVRNEGALSGNERLAGILKTSSGNQYQLAVTEAAIYTLNLSSDEVDTLLRVNGEGLEMTNDDGDENTNSRIETYLQPGNYTVTASAVNEASSGTYVLAIENRAVPKGVDLRNGGLLQPNTPITGMSSAAPLTYEVRIERPSLVVLRMKSSEIDAHLALTGNGVDASDDDGAGEGNDAQLSLLLEPGTYKVSATNVGNRGGLFTLDYSAVPMTRSTLNTLRPGQYANGTLRTNAPSQAILRIETAGTYVIDLASSEFDAFLRLQGAHLNLEDDDSAGAANARLTTHLEPGEYRLQLSAVAQPGQGRFRVSVVAQP